MKDYLENSFYKAFGILEGVKKRMKVPQILLSVVLFLLLFNLALKNVLYELLAASPFRTHSERFNSNENPGGQFLRISYPDAKLNKIS